MYSPKIEESLIPILYKKAKESKQPMTKIVNDILKEKLCQAIENKPSIISESTKSGTKYNSP